MKHSTFWGYTFVRLHERRTGRVYYGGRPSPESMKRLWSRIHKPNWNVLYQTKQGKRKKAKRHDQKQEIFWNA